MTSGGLLLVLPPAFSVLPLRFPYAACCLHSHLLWCLHMPATRTEKSKCGAPGTGPKKLCTCTVHCGGGTMIPQSTWYTHAKYRTVAAFPTVAQVLGSALQPIGLSGLAQAGLNTAGSSCGSTSLTASTGDGFSGDTRVGSSLAATCSLPHPTVADHPDARPGPGDGDVSGAGVQEHEERDHRMVRSLCHVSISALTNATACITGCRRGHRELPIASHTTTNSLYPRSGE